MTETLLISYTPRNGFNNTEKLVDIFIEGVADKTHLTHFDLIKDHRSLLIEEDLSALFERKLSGRVTSNEEKKVLKSVDLLSHLLQLSENVVLAFPMQTFSFPETVKGWVTTILQYSETPIYTEGCHFREKQNSLVLMIDGEKPIESPMKEDVSPDFLFATCFTFVGNGALEVVSSQCLSSCLSKVEELIMQTEVIQPRLL